MAEMDKDLIYRFALRGPSRPRNRQAGAKRQAESRLSFRARKIISVVELRGERETMNRDSRRSPPWFGAQAEEIRPLAILADDHAIAADRAAGHGQVVVLVPGAGIPPGIVAELTVKFVFAKPAKAMDHGSLLVANLVSYGTLHRQSSGQRGHERLETFR